MEFHFVMVWSDFGNVQTKTESRIDAESDDENSNWSSPNTFRNSTDTRRPNRSLFDDVWGLKSL